MNKMLFIAALLVFCGATSFAQKTKTVTLTSPDGKLHVAVAIGDQISYSASYDGKELIAPSTIGMTLKDGPVLGESPKLRKQKVAETDEQLKPLYGKRDVIEDHYKELRLDFRGNYAVIFRAYDEGFAYRFVTSFKNDIIIAAEKAQFNFPGDFTVSAIHPRSGGFQNSYEDFYSVRKLTQMPDSIAALPVMITARDGTKMVFSEAALDDYPGLYVRKSKDHQYGLEATFPKYPVKVEKSGYKKFDLMVTERADYIAKTQGSRAFPWRFFKIATDDRQLLDTDLVYKLSDPQAPGIDFSWVKPGKVAWDWWNALNLLGVDFKTGINTESYKYFIDFAAANGIQYVNLDEGWSDPLDVMKLSDAIDLKEILRYAKSKNVGIILWCVHWALDEKLNEAMDWFESLGVKGLKIDFMDRDDQVMVEYYHRIARAAAQHHMLVDFHGAYKPAGLRRLYPNVINREAVRGLEYDKFNPQGTTPEYAVTIPFIRMMAGPMDYTPGAMHNAQKANFSHFFERPMSQGTRCQQLAMYVVYDAPLEMLSDAPTAYQAEPEILDYLRKVPTTWDETVALDGKVGDYAVVARRSATDWWVGGMTDWTPRTLTVDFSFLGQGQYKATIYQDGINADRIGNDYKKLEKTVNAQSKLEFKLAPGGGFAIHLTKVQ